MSRVSVRLSLVMVLLAGFVVAGLQLGIPNVRAQGSTVTATLEQQGSEVTMAERQQARSLSHLFAELARTTTPSVVNVSSTRKISGSQAMGPNGLQDSPFRDFFGDQFFERFFQPGPQEQWQRGQGTGFIVDTQGHILTNNHVIDGAEEITVRLDDDRTFTATVVGTDPKTDLAVLHIDATDLQPVTLGDSDALEVGEWVIAVGNPFGLNSSITSGIVSAKGRANVGLADYEDFIQTDAAINPGNSGGPLLDLDGRVVGVNTAIATRSGGYMGIGFAIPINMAQSIMKSLIDEGRVVRGWMGVLIQELNADLAASFDFDSTDGVLIGDVTPNGPADHAGLQAGDILVQYDGRAVHNVAQLRERVAATAPGEKVKVQVYRNGDMKTITMKIGELETQVAVGDNRPQSVQLGMTVQTMTPQVAAQLQLDDKQRGVVVTQVDPMGAAARAGIAVRDVILSVQGESTEDVAAFRKALDNHDLDKGVRLSVRRDGNRRFVLLRVPSEPS